MHLQFRKGLEQDRQALFDLLQDNQMEPEVDPGEFLLAVSEDKLAGAIRVECEEQALYLRPLVVASDFQGKGIGRALVHELSKTHAVLHVVARGSAVEFYRHIGFTAVDWGQVPERYRQECELCDGSIGMCSAVHAIYESGCYDRATRTLGSFSSPTFPPVPSPGSGGAHGDACREIAPA